MGLYNDRPNMKQTKEGETNRWGFQVPQTGEHVTKTKHMMPGMVSRGLVFLFGGFGDLRT